MIIEVMGVDEWATRSDGGRISLVVTGGPQAL